VEVMVSLLNSRSIVLLCTGFLCNASLMLISVFFY
jgi:hypothetical protein